MRLLPYIQGSTASLFLGGWAQEVVGEGNEVLQMSEGVFVEHLADYPNMELSWLQQLYESTQEASSAGATLNNVMNSMLMPSLSGLTKKVGTGPWSARCPTSSDTGAMYLNSLPSAAWGASLQHAHEPFEASLSVD